MSNIGIRIQEKRKELGITQRILAEKAGITEATLSRYETSERQPKSEVLAIIAKSLNCTTDYLLTGLNTLSTTKLPQPQKENVWQHTTSKSSIQIPVLGVIKAGLPLMVVENIIDYEEISLEMMCQGDHFALQIQGNSMEPRIKERDVVIIRKQSDIANGDIAVVLVDGENATIKQVKKTEQGIMLIPYNKDYETLFFTNDEIEKLPVSIIGKVVELRGKF